MPFRRILVLAVMIALCSSLHAASAVQGIVANSSDDPVSGALVTFTDESAPDNSFSGYTDGVGHYQITLPSVSVEEETPVPFALRQNFPNPFNPSTTIPFTLDTAGRVRLTVYNVMGQKIATLLDDYCSLGAHSVKWDGLDDNGNNVSAGLYLYKLTFGNRHETRKMLLIDGGSGISGVSGAKVTFNSDGQAAFKQAAGTSYTVKIEHESIVTYEENGVMVDDGQTLDFTVIGITVYEGLTFVTIPAVTSPYEMKHAYSVTLSSYEMSTTEVTNTQYAAYLTSVLASGDVASTSLSVTGLTGGWSGQEYLDLDCNFCEIGYRDGVFIVDSGKENRPVTAVTWYGSKAFANYYGFDLPTEAEWQYAASGGMNYEYSTDDGTIDDTKANYNNNIGHVIDVGSYPANPFGLYNMAGNVQEWCHDWYGSYPDGAADNYTGANSGSMRVSRGGDWLFYDSFCQSDRRFGFHPGSGLNPVGFRVVRRSNDFIITDPILQPSLKAYELSPTAPLLVAGSSFIARFQIENPYVIAMEYNLDVRWRDSTGAYGEFRPTTCTVTIEPGTGWYERKCTVPINLPEGVYAVAWCLRETDYSPIEDSGYIENSVTLKSAVGPDGSDLHDLGGLTFATIPGGTFQMGDEDGDLWDYCRPVHTVTVSAFDMSVYEVTNAQFAMYLTEALASGDITADSSGVTGKTGEWSGNQYINLSGSHDTSNRCWISYSDGIFSVEKGKENWPVVYVTWYGAKAFAKYCGFDLPTEAQWEYACRGGKHYRYGTDDGAINSTTVNYNVNVGHPTEAEHYPSNPYVLFDMSGNVWEWCADWYGSYTSDSAQDPTGAQTGSARVRRGGSWNYNPSSCRSACRSYGYPDDNRQDTGFRVVRR